MSLLKHISNFLIEKVLPIKFKVWLLDRLTCDIAAQGEDGDTELAHINSYEAKLLRSVGGSGTINKTTGLRQYGGGGSRGGGGGGGTTTQTVTKEEFPPEIRPYIKDILERAQAQEEARQATGYPVYPGPRIAQFTPEERAAQAGIVSLVGSSQPSFDIARGLTAAAAMEDTAPAIQSRMSPYMQNVVDIQKREAQRDADIRRQQLAAQAVGARAFGGSRDAIQQAEFDRNLQQQLADIQATGQQAAFQQAQQSLANLRQRQMGAGQQMAGLGTAQQASAMKELGALAGVGEQQRQQQQKALDLGFQQFREEQTYPEASLQQYQSIIRGFPISPTTTQTQQAILPQPSLSQQLIGGAGALAGLGIAGQIPKLFEGGGQTNLKPVPEDNVGLSKLPQDVRNKMGFMSSGGSFPDLSGDGKITQKDILLGRGVINKKGGKRISKSDNKEYTEMLMALLEGKGRELTGMETMNDGGVVKMQSGQQPFIGGDVGGLSSFSLDPRDSLELRQKRDRAKYDPVRKAFYDPLTNEVIPEIEMSREQPMKFSLGVPRNVPVLKEGEVTRVRDEGSGISFKLPEFSQMPVVKGIAGLGESALEKIGEGRRAVVKQASDILEPIGGIIKGGFTPRGEEDIRLGQEELGQTLKTKAEELGEFGRSIVDKGKRAMDSIEDTLAGQQPGSFLQAAGLEQKLKRTRDEVSMLNNRISEAKSPTAKDKLIKMRDNKIQEANSLATRYDSNVDSYEDLINKFELDRTKQPPVSEPKAKEKVTDETKTKPKEETPVLNKNEEKGASEYLKNNIDPKDPNADLLLEESKNLLKDNEPTKEAIENSSSYLRDIITKQEKESKADFEKRRGFAIAQMGFQIMGGARIVDAAAGLMGNLSKLEQEKLERKNKQFDRELQIRALELDEMKTKKTLELGEKELALKSKYYSILEDKYANAGKLDEKDLMGFVSVSGLDDIEGITKQDFSAITFRAKELIDNGMRPDTAIKNATAQVAAENRVDEKPGFFKSFTNWFKGLGGGDTIPTEE
tara:strand:+ start:7590 stop:10667 length:3078 start_codon:yes stop_codon:yes gene_type:complete